MNAKISEFLIYVERIIYLLLYSLHDCTFNIMMKLIDTKFTFEWYVPGSHFYQIVWFPIISEEDLKCRHEKENEVDEFALTSKFV